MTTPIKRSAGVTGTTISPGKKTKTGDDFVANAPSALEAALKILIAIDRVYTQAEWNTVKAYLSDIDIKLHQVLARDPERVAAATARYKQATVALAAAKAKLPKKAASPPKTEPMAS